MPHFSPISWMVTGFIFYLLLMLFVTMFWWVQSYMFPSVLNIGGGEFSCLWKWV